MDNKICISKFSLGIVKYSILYIHSTLTSLIRILVGYYKKKKKEKKNRAKYTECNECRFRTKENDRENWRNDFFIIALQA